MSVNIAMHKHVWYIITIMSFAEELREPLDRSELREFRYWKEDPGAIPTSKELREFRLLDRAEGLHYENDFYLLFCGSKELLDGYMGIAGRNDVMDLAKTYSDMYVPAGNFHHLQKISDETARIVWDLAYAAGKAAAMLEINPLEE